MHVVMFHHALGLTPGIESFAAELRAAGHEVTTPDLFDGSLFATVEAGVAHAEGLGFDEIIKRGVAAAATLPADIVYCGFSLGLLPAQTLAQTRPGARGAILFYDAIPATEFSETWPAGVALQIHVNRDDEWADLTSARLLADETGGELFVYPGSSHLFADSSTADYEPDSTALALERTLGFLERCD